MTGQGVPLEDPNPQRAERPTLDGERITDETLTQLGGSTLGAIRERCFENAVIRHEWTQAEMDRADLFAFIDRLLDRGPFDA